MKPPVPRDYGDELPCQRRPELYLTDDSNTQRVLAAKFHCLACPLVEPCAEWGIRHEKHLVWGATSPDDRDEIRKARDIVVETPSMDLDRPYRRSA